MCVYGECVCVKCVVECSGSTAEPKSISLLNSHTHGSRVSHISTIHSHSSPKFQEKLQSHLFDSLQQMPNAHLLTLPIISAGARELLARALEDCIAPAHSACLVHRCPGLPGMRDAVTNFALHVHV